MSKSRSIEGALVVRVSKHPLTYDHMIKNIFTAFWKIASCKNNNKTTRFAAHNKSLAIRIAACDIRAFCETMLLAAKLNFLGCGLIATKKMTWALVRK